MTDWNSTVNYLSKTKGAYNSWVKYLTFKGIIEKKAHFSVPTPFFKEWILKSYTSDIIKAFANDDILINSVNIDVETVVSNSYKPAKKEIVNNNNADSLTAELFSPARVFDDSFNTAPVKEVETPLFSTKTDANYTFDNFIVGDSNEFAYAVAKRVAEGKIDSCNPLFLYSSVGLGKTHLMQAIANFVMKNTNKQVIYLTAEKYLNLFVKAISAKDSNKSLAFKEMFRSADILMIDDIQFLIGKKMTMEEFLFTFNELIENGKQLVLSANKAPSALIGLDERLKTKMSAGIVADIMPASYELRLNILKAKAMHYGSTIPNEVLSFLAEKIPSNIRELEGALRRIVAHSEIMGEQPSLSRAKIVLKDLLTNSEERVISVSEIKNKVASFYKIRQNDIMSSSREKGIAVPRQIAMYISKILTTKSYPEIGREFNRDHTTILYGVRKIESLIKSNKAVMEQINTIRGSLL